MEQGAEEGGLGGGAAVALDDVTDHVPPSDVGKRGGVGLQLPPPGTIDQCLPDQEA